MSKTVKGTARFGKTVEVSPQEFAFIIKDTEGEQDESVILDTLYDALELVDFEVEGGVTNVTATISFTIRGSVEFDAQEWNLTDSLDDVDEDDPEYWIRDVAESYIEDAINDAISDGYSIDREWDIESTDVETG